MHTLLKGEGENNVRYNIFYNKMNSGITTKYCKVYAVNQGGDN